MPTWARSGLCAAGAMLCLAGMAAGQTRDTTPEEHEAFELGGYGSTRFEAARAPGRTGLVLRRLVGEVEANRGRFHLESELELEGKPAAGPDDDAEQELEVEQLWLAYAASPALGLRAGIMVPPVGRLNARNEDYLWDYPRRPLIDRGVPVLPASAAWRAWGVGATTERALPGGRRLHLEAYALSPTEQAFAVVSPAGAGVPAEADVRASDDVVAGGALPRAFSARAALRSSAGSEVALSGYVGRYGRDAAGAAAPSWTVGLDGVRHVGSFIVEGEALYARYGRVDAVLAQFARAARRTLAPSGGGDFDVALQGLARTRSGVWLDLERPIALPSLVARAPALLVPVARYEQARLGDAVTGFSLSGAAGDGVVAIQRATLAEERMSLGLAFRPLPKLVLHAVAERTRALRGRLLEPALATRSVTALCLGLAVGF